MMIIVGSTALQYHGMSRKTPSDTDIWTDKEFIPKQKGVESVEHETRMLFQERFKL